MARVAAEAFGDGRDWTLVSNSEGYRRRLRSKGYFAGHDTKDGLKARIAEELERLIAEEGEGNVVNLQSYITPSARPPDSISVEVRNYYSSGLSGRSIETCGPEPSPSLSPSPPPAALALLTSGRETSSPGVEDLRSSRVRGVVLSRELMALRGSPQLSPTSAAENHYKRRKLAAAAEQQLLPVSSTKAPVQGLLLAAAAATGSLSPQAFAVSPLDFFPPLRRQVDNFVIHACHKLVSVTALPVCIDGVLTGGASSLEKEKVYLVGTTGPDRIMFKERVKMWRLVLNPAHKPQYFLRTREGEWVRLLDAHEDYRKVMSDVLALGHFLNFVKKLPNASPRAAEQELRKMCMMHNSKPQLDRLSRYIKVIRSFIEKDIELAKASILRKIFPNLFPKTSFPKMSSPQTDEELELEDRRDLGGLKRKAGRLPLGSEGTDRKEKRYKVMAKKDVQKRKLLKPSTPDLQSEYDSDDEFKKRKISSGVNRKAIDGERLQSHCDDGLGPDHRPEPDLRRTEPHRRLFSPAEVNVEDPPICIICDDGGNLLYCDGPCHRHFHPTKGSGVDSFCKTLEMTEAEVEVAGKYYCPNCKHNQQQCFVCGNLGSSVATSDGPPEVRRCDVSFCNKFFHAECTAELFFPVDVDDWRDFADAVNAGHRKLLCPRHCCSVCGEVEMTEPGMLVQCRRCPKAWHRECLTDFSRSLQKPTVRIWSQHDREFIYCRDHKIRPKTQTPARDHLRFPTVK